MIITKENIGEFLSDNGKTLNISYKDITAIEYLPQSLVGLLCYNTSITELPPLPQSLEWLLCYNTSITELPPLPQSLEGLDCNNTNLPKWQQVGLYNKEDVDKFRNKIKKHRIMKNYLELI